MNCIFYSFFVVVISIIILNKGFYNNTMNYNKIDQIIENLRKKFIIMNIDGRIKIDLCDRIDKIGKNRENERLSVGDNCEPFISRECIYILDNILPRNGIGLEWSSGSSTLFFSYRLHRLFSIEHQKSWYLMMKRIIEKKKVKENIKLLWIDNDNLSYCLNESKYISKFYEHDICYKTYVSSKLIPHYDYDFISIDGRARTGCLLRAIKLIKKENGIIIIDNAERDRYKWSYKIIPSEWRTYDFLYKYGLVKMFITK